MSLNNQSHYILDVIEFQSELCDTQSPLTDPIGMNDGAFQMGYIALPRALRSENNHGHHIEVSFQTEVLKTDHFNGPFGMKDFEGYN